MTIVGNVVGYQHEKAYVICIYSLDFFYCDLIVLCIVRRHKHQFVLLLIRVQVTAEMLLIFQHVAF